MYLCVHNGYKGGTQGGVRKGCALVLVPAPLAYLITKEPWGVLSYLYLQGYLVQVQVLEVLRTIRVLGVLVPLTYIRMLGIVTRGTRKV